MSTPNNMAVRPVPGRAIEGGRVAVEAVSSPFVVDPPPVVRLGGVRARLAAASSRRLVLIVPAGVDGGHVPIALDDRDDPVGLVEIGRPIATGLHQVDGPAFDRNGTLYATFSGARGQSVPVSIFRVPQNGVPEPLAAGIVNATSLAFDPFGDLCVSSRFGGAIYRVDRRGEITVFAEGFGRPQGLAVDVDGTLYVAEALAGASGVYRVRPGGRRELMVVGDALVGLAFHPERGVAVASADTVYLFDPW